MTLEFGKILFKKCAVARPAAPAPATTTSAMARMGGMEKRIRLR
jgi:hypothetical protein